MCLQFSFLYAEYSTHQCFWESILMARKLLLLLVTICLGMAPGGDTAVALLQCQTAVLLLMLFLALQQWILPFRRTLLNRLETICLLATALTFGLLMFLPMRPGSEDRGRSGVAVLVLVVVLNGIALLYLLYHAARLSWVIMEECRWAKWCKEVAAGMRQQLGFNGCCRRRRRQAP
jgi:heme/copper-type cytochrome/quinol oxidase subunit 4